MNTPAIPKNWTVILLRGRKFAERLNHDEPFGTDAYVAYVFAGFGEPAVKAARQQVLKADRKDFRDQCREAGVRLVESDYIPLMIFEGHHTPVLWGWQL